MGGGGVLLLEGLDPENVSNRRMVGFSSPANEKSQEAMTGFGDLLGRRRKRQCFKKKASRSPKERGMRPGCVLALGGTAPRSKGKKNSEARERNRQGGSIVKGKRPNKEQSTAVKKTKQPRTGMRGAGREERVARLGLKGGI